LRAGRTVAVMLTILSAIVSIFEFRVRSRASLELELIALRHQVTVLRRQRPGRPRFSSLDRSLWVWLYRIWPQVIYFKNGNFEKATQEYEQAIGAASMRASETPDRGARGRPQLAIGISPAGDSIRSAGPADGNGADDCLAASFTCTCSVIPFAFFQGCSRACKRAIAPLGQPGDRDIRLPGYQVQRLTAQQSRNDRHFAERKTASGHSRRRPKGRLRQLWGSAPVIPIFARRSVNVFVLPDNRYVESAGTHNLTRLSRR
jgi:hypothetical protein